MHIGVCVRFDLSRAALCLLEFTGISEGMNSASDDVTVRHLDTLESRYGYGAFEEAYVLDI